MSRPALTLGSLFSGIGGLDLGLERAGFRVRWQVEIEAYNRAVLAKHWSDVPRFEDVRTFPPQDLDASSLRVDVIAGGFPCEDISRANPNRTGLAGSRSGLWSAFAGIVSVLRPQYVVVENVPALRSPIRDRIEKRIVGPAPLAGVLGDLAALGFDAEWGVLSAAGVGAPHLRERLFVIAHAHRHLEQQSEGRVGEVGRRARDSSTAVADTRQQRCDARRGQAKARQQEGEEPEGRVAPDADRVGLERLARRPARQRPSETEPRASGARTAKVGSAGLPLSELAGVAGPTERRDAARSATPERGWWTVEPDVVRMVHGVPRRVDRIRGLGRAVVPQVAEKVGRRLLEIIRQHRG